MSGDRYNRSSKLSDQLRKKLAAAIMPMLRDMHALEVALDFTPSVHNKSVGADCVVRQKNYQPEKPQLIDPLKQWRDDSLVLKTMPLVEEALEFYHTPCHFEAVIQFETPITQSQTQCHTVAFDSVQKVRLRDRSLQIVPQSGVVNHGISVPENKTVIQSVDIPKVQSIRSHTKPIGNFRLRHDKMPGKYWALPIKKKPLSPLKISRDIREEMRELLAKKADTMTTNIQIKVVYERMDMTAIANIDQDDQGNLLCFPKADALKKIRLGSPYQSVQSFLIFGTRTDTQEVIRVLMPMPEM